jgi:N-acetylglucosamine-6-phosphate deacetylase
MKRAPCILFLFCIAACAATGKHEPLSSADPVPSALLIQNARMFDGERVLESASVLVRNGLIEAIGPDVNCESGCTVVDGRGKTLLPGLIDSHTHVWDASHRANRRQLVNLRQVQRIEPGPGAGLVLSLRNGREVEMSRRQAQRFRQVMSP